MNLILISMFMICFMVMFMIITITMISKKVLIDKEKSTPFECGFNPMSYSRLPFSIHFFMIAVIFLIFDVEIIMIMPMIFTMKTSMMKYWLMTSMFFLVILLVGLFHEWKNGMIQWSK